MKNAKLQFVILRWLYIFIQKKITNHKPMLYNYYTLYDIPLTVQVDATVLKRKYYQLSKLYHPDYYDVSTSKLTKAENLELSARVNEGYTLLQNPTATLGYVLRLVGAVLPNEKYVLSPDFLMEVMELNETIDTATTAVINTLNEELAAVIQPLIKKNVTELGQVELTQLKDYYYKNKYLNRLLQRTEGVSHFE